MADGLIKGIVMDEVVQQSSPAIQQGFEMGVLAALETAVPLLEAYVDDEPCVLDHHGYCQSHGLSEAPCINTRVKEFLRAAGPEMVWRSTVTAPGLFWCFGHRPALAVTLDRLADLSGITVECVQCGRRLSNG